MVRDIRTMPLGLIAPLKQSALAALRDLANGASMIPQEEHRARLLDLGLIEIKEDGHAITPLGRERLICDR